MTPLARYFADQLCLGITKRDQYIRSPEASAELAIALHDTHFFDVSECYELVDDLMGQLPLCRRDDHPLGVRLFLPAEKTWLEMARGGWRVASLLEQMDDAVRVTHFTSKFSSPSHTIPLTFGYHFKGEWIDDWERHKAVVDLGPFEFEGNLDWARSRPLALRHIPALLVLINSPSVIGRRTIHPTRQFGVKIRERWAGRTFPLHAWHEIKLEVSKPPEIDDGEPHQADLTGRRALHFVRKHIRIRRGQLEYVSAHWRGDAAIGIKRARYKAVA